MGLVDHFGFPQDLRRQGGEIEVLHLDAHGVVVPPSQEQELLHQLLHGVGLLPDGVDSLLPDGRVVLAPAVQQIGIALDHGDGGAQLVGSVRDEAHLGAIGLVDAVQHGVDGLGQLPQLLLRARYRDAGVQMGGVDLVQLVGENGELLRRHARGGVQLGRGGSQLLDGPGGLFDSARVFEEVGQQRGQLADHQDAKAEHP